ncbi:MAG: hypothetical protein SOZ80_03850 [Prevotella sp.]|uniref:hypothetical protein n=1 Tax=Prevotella sp. TaxID=59823 RepID=UPI002A2AF4C7|nr:hypothetical protein [Prevotella sp.]MDD7317291.1 hypothetical protein [Prevotellaceae bacterium]MDY4019895.1 hypothetical protein [Prevotella sp.]
MKNIIFTAAIALLTAVPAMAQNNGETTEKPVRNISAEILGPSNLIGIHYDSRIEGNRGWGYSAGLAWGYSNSSTLFNAAEQYNIVSFVPRANYLVGKKSSKLELGFGINIGFLTGKTEYDMVRMIEKDGVMQWEYAGHVKEHRDIITYYLFGNIGYRLQPSKGFTLRAGVSPSFGFGGSHTIDALYLIPYISFGKSF